MQRTARIAAVHGVLWSSDPWYRWSWYVWPAALALLVVGWICIDMPTGAAPPSAVTLPKPAYVPATNTSSATNASASASLQSWVQDQLNRCFSNQDPNVALPACTNLINTGQIRGQQLARAHVRRGYLQREKDPDRAIVDYDTALKVQPSADALAGRAWIFMNRGQYDAAVADLNKAIALSPQPAAMATARFYRGYALLKLENYPQALTDLNEAIRLSPDNADYYLARGEVQQGLESYDAALRDFDEFGKRAPRDARGLVARGAVLEAMGKPQEALAAFESAVARSPDNAFAISERDRLRAAQNAADPPKKEDDPAK